MPEAGHTVVRLGSSDVDLHREALALYARAFDDIGSYSARQPDERYLADLLGRADFIQLVALAEDRVVGALSAYVLPKFEQARSEIYLYDLAVDSAHRRSGIARSLLAALDPIARDAGAWVVFVQADYEDAPAIALYESLGQREEVLHFDLRIEGG